MNPVQVIYSQGSVVLRARNSELLILPEHVTALVQLKEPGKFSDYFMNEALVNRPARKLFTAWLRKDKGVWARLYKALQDSVTAEDLAATPEEAPAEEAKSVAPIEKVKKAVPKAVEEEPEEKPVTKKKAVVKKVVKKAPASKVSGKKLTPAKTTKQVARKASPSAMKKSRKKV